ncbi:MAG TPA: glycosyltransferase family 4 protein [Patescibacteria group bacterium]|nr:glycosyltransferase family 4 protein [Patescibacteria group bacterium]
MKVLFSLSYYDPYLSGVSVYAKRLAEGLSDKGETVEILTAQYDKKLAKKEKIGKVLVTRVPFLWRVNKGLVMPAWLWQGYQKVRAADSVICHLPQPESLWLLFLARLFKKKALVVYHCDVVFASSLVNKIIGKTLMAINFLCCALAQKVINSSEDYAKHSPVLRHFLNKVVIIYPPLDKIFLRKDSGETEADKIVLEKLKGRKDKIGYVGRVAADKGIEYLLQAIPYLGEELKDFGLFLVGPKETVGEEKYWREINSLSQRYLGKAVFLGKLTDEELVSFLRKLDVLVLPSVNSTEAFGMIQMEAMVSGCPVVASNLPGVRVPVKLTQMGEVVSPRNPQEISRAIIKVIKNKNRYVKNGRRAKEIFSLEKAIDQFQSLLFPSGNKFDY